MPLYHLQVYQPHLYTRSSIRDMDMHGGRQSKCSMGKWTITRLMWPLMFRRYNSIVVTAYPKVQSYPPNICAPQHFPPTFSWSSPHASPPQATSKLLLSSRILPNSSNIQLITLNLMYSLTSHLRTNYNQHNVKHSTLENAKELLMIYRS